MLPHPDSTKKKRPALKNSAFTKFKYVAQGRYIRDGNLPHSCRGRVYSSTLGAWCMYCRERQRHYGGWGVLNAVVRSSYCDSTSSRLELCQCCVPLLCASEVCCAVVVLLSTAVVLVYARGTYALSKCTNACSEKKSIRDPNLLHERHLWRVMYCMAMVMSRKGVATVAVDASAVESDSA